MIITIVTMIIRLFSVAWVAQPRSGVWKHIEKGRLMSRGDLSLGRWVTRSGSGLEKFVSTLCCVCKTLLFFVLHLFLLLPLLFFHPESFKLAALENSRGFNTMQEVLYFPPPPSSVASFIQSVSKLGEIKAEKNLFAELDIPVVQKKSCKAESKQGR